MAQTKTRIKTSKRKKSVRVKVKNAKQNRAMPKMSRTEHEKMEHKEPAMMGMGQMMGPEKTMQRDERAQQLSRDNPQMRWENPASQTRQGNTQQQWTQRVAEGQRNPEPAPSEKEGEPEEE
jgi:hypothetical protein